MCFIYNVDQDGMQCVYALEKKLYARSLKQKRSVIIAATVSVFCLLLILNACIMTCYTTRNHIDVKLTIQPFCI